jgi:hypothetical protein
MGLVLYKQFQLSEVQVKANISKPKSETTTIEAENTNIEISQTGLKINRRFDGKFFFSLLLTIENRNYPV